MNTFKMNTFRFVLVLLLIYSVTANANIVNTGHGETDRPVETGQSGFLKGPVKYMAEVYEHYHNWQLDSGISKAKAALKIIDKVYSGNPQAELKDPMLRLNKAYQIKSTLHTMLGMLYHRKSISDQGSPGDRRFDPVLNKLDRGEKIMDRDLDSLAEALEKDQFLNKSDDYVIHSRNEFLRAIKIDPLNPVPHYQLGNVYSAMAILGDTEEAEKEFFTAARLTLDEGNKESALRVLETIKSLNPESYYISRIENLIAGGNDEK